MINSECFMFQNSLRDTKSAQYFETEYLFTQSQQKFQILLYKGIVPNYCINVSIKNVEMLPTKSSWNRILEECTLNNSKLKATEEFQITNIGR